MVYFMVQHTKNEKNIPKGSEIFGMAITDQHFPFQGPPKFTHIGIVDLKIYHLATLVETCFFTLSYLHPLILRLFRHVLLHHGVLELTL
jgi:hypothetical protein